MALFSFNKKQSFLNSEQQSNIVAAIQEAEKRTSGEVRVFVESKCKYVSALDRAADIFYGLKMDHTAERNAVLVYLAHKDRQVAIFADEGIHSRMGQQFWVTEVQRMLKHFHDQHFGDGIVAVVKDIGEALHENFPYLKDVDKNELPDDIIFGK